MSGPRRKSLKERLEGNLQPIPFSGCWIWMGCTTKKYGCDKYGVIGEGGSAANGAKQITTHRAAWMVYRGAIPDGMHVLHRCDVPLCCNPHHLFLGSHSDNMRDCYTKGRMRQAWPTVLNEERVKAMRLLISMNWSDAEVAAAFEVSIQTVERVKERHGLLRLVA